MVKFMLVVVSLFGPPSVLASGPITSGGGNAASSLPAAPGLVEFYLSRRVPQTLNVILNKQYQRLSANEVGDSRPIWQKFFRNPELVFRKLQALRVYIKKARPCKDKNGQDTDASIFAPPGFDVCISSFSLGRKLTQTDIVPQLVGLLAHEYGHIVADMNEREANEIQDRVISIASDVLDVHSPITSVRDHLFRIQDLLSKARTEDNYNSPSAICLIFSEIEKVHLPQVAQSNPRFSVLDWRGQVEIGSLLYKVHSLRKQACAESKSYGWENEGKSYDFQKHDKILLDEILNVEIERYYKFYPLRLFPWVRKIAVATSEGSNSLNHNYLIEMQEIQSLVELMRANTEALYWLSIEPQ